MKITKNELKQIIREEAVKFKKKIELEKELTEIQRQLDEVHAGGDMDSNKNDGVHAGQKKAEFDTKSNNGGFGALVEEEEEESEEVVAEEVVTEEDVNENLEEEVNIEEIFAEMEEGSDGEVVTEEEEVVAEDVVTEEEETIEENMEEPMEGDKIVNHADADKVNDNMEKVNESKEEDKNILSEEASRMQALAGIKKIL